MRMLTFSKRTAKEILRDPLNIAFGLGFPLVLLILFTTIQKNAPVEMFKIENTTPGLSVFGLSFMTLFSSVLIAKDRSSSLLQRLYTTPLTPADYIFGYILPVVPIGILQSVICYAAAVILGLDFSINILWAILLVIPVSLFFISLGLLCGSVLSEKQVGGVCGALLTNLTIWLSGVAFDLDLVGGAFKKVAYLLPFVHAVEMERSVLAGDFGDILPHLWWVLGYMVLAVILAVTAFTLKTKNN